MTIPWDTPMKDIMNGKGVLEELSKKPPIPKTLFSYFVKGLAIKVVQGERIEIWLAMDNPEGKGTIVLRECGYGWDVFKGQDALDGDAFPFGMLDLFYQSEHGKQVPEGPAVQFVISDPRRDDMMGRARFFEGHTEVDFEYGVSLFKNERGKMIDLHREVASDIVFMIKE